MQKIRLNIIPDGELPIIYASQFDDNRDIGIYVYEGDDNIIFTDETLSFTIRKPDDNLVTLSAEQVTEDEDTYIKVSLSEQACACFGECICELKIVDSDNYVLHTLKCVLAVERSPEHMGLTSASEIYDLDNQIRELMPTKTSELDNDSGFITSADVPTKTSELDNDSGYITSADVPTKTSELDNDSGFITSADVPTKTSELYNDSGFITSADVPSNLGDLDNVEISSPTNSQILGYDGSTNKWKNINNSGGGTSIEVHDLTLASDVIDRFTLNSGKYFEISGIIFVDIIMTCITATGINADLFTGLPNAKVETRIGGIQNDTNTYNDKGCRVTTNGIIRLMSNSASGQQYHFYGSYPKA